MSCGYTESPGASIAITPCSDDGEHSTFTCGLNTTGCQSDTSTWTMTYDASPSGTSSHANATKMYTSSDMAGLGCGLGLPLGFFLVVALCALYKEKQNHTGPKLMYKLPDNHTDFSIGARPPPSAFRAPSHYSNFSVDSRLAPRTRDGAEPADPHSFLDRYETMKRDGKLSAFQVHEMDGVSPHEPAERHELSDKRFSTPTGK